MRHSDQSILLYLQCCAFCQAAVVSSRSVQCRQSPLDFLLWPVCSIAQLVLPAVLHTALCKVSRLGTIDVRRDARKAALPEWLHEVCRCWTLARLWLATSVGLHSLTSGPTLSRSSLQELETHCGHYAQLIPLGQAYGGAPT